MSKACSLERSLSTSSIFFMLSVLRGGKSRKWSCIGVLSLIQSAALITPYLGLRPLAWNFILVKN